MAHHYPQVVAGLQIDLRHLTHTYSMWCTSHDDRTGLQGRPLAQVRNNLRDTEDHVVRERTLHRLSVQDRLQLNVSRALDQMCGNQRWT